MKKIKRRGAFRRKPRKKPSLPLSEFFLSKSGKSKIQELRIRDDIKGKTALGGNFWTWGSQKHDRGDVENRTVLVEAKQTKKPFFALSEKILKKIDKESFNHGKVPAVVIEFLSMPFGTETQWAAIPKSFMCEKLEAQSLLIKNTLKFKTTKRQIRLKITDLRKLEQEATASGKIPTIMLEFLRLGGGVPGEWAVIPYSVFLKIAKPEVSNPDPVPDEDSVDPETNEES